MGGENSYFGIASPSIVFCHLPRWYLDLNREVVQAWMKVRLKYNLYCDCA